MNTLETFEVQDVNGGHELAYRNMFGDLLALRRVNDLLIFTLNQRDDRGEIQFEFNVPHRPETPEKLTPYAQAGNILFSIIFEFGVNGAMIQAQQEERVVAHFAIAPQYRDQVLQFLYL